MADLSYDRITKKAKTLPDELQLCDEDGNPLDGESLVVLNFDTKLALATCMLQSKQSLETTLIRILTKQLKEMDKKNG